MPWADKKLKVSARECDSRLAYLSCTTITNKYELEGRGLLLSHIDGW